MYRVDIENKRLIEIPVATYSQLNLRERFDIQEWIAGKPEILGEPLLIISKELILPSGRRLDLLAVDKDGALVVIELKRDNSGSDVEWQAI
ncbi:MAG: MmcB family DNA repair protein, partial [Clostridia bacterium]|nr:MmcB family DNA repair protein [Clostridia bacterium]